MQIIETVLYVPKRGGVDVISINGHISVSALLAADDWSVEPVLLSPTEADDFGHALIRAAGIARMADTSR